MEERGSGRIGRGDGGERKWEDRERVMEERGNGRIGRG